MPKTIDCEIKDDLIDACISGDIVTICGTMKTELQSDNKVNKHRVINSTNLIRDLEGKNSTRIRPCMHPILMSTLSRILILTSF